jgi:putative heme-binding domain-containing protein
VLNHADPQVFLVGSVGLLSGNRALARPVLERCQELLTSQVSPDYSAENQASAGPSDRLRAGQQLDLLRVVQLALIHGKLTADDVPALSPALLTLYPTRSHPQNRELVRLLVYLQEPQAVPAFAKQLESDIPRVEKLHLGGYACRLNRGWDTASKLSLLKYYEAARSTEGGYSVSAYVENFARDFFTRLSLPERHHLLARGEKWPASALSVLAKLPAGPGADILKELRELDQRLIPLRQQGDAYRRLQVGVVAVLGRSGEPASLEYLRQIYHADPSRRPPITMSLTQHPAGDNWPYLVDALKTVEGTVAREVLAALTRVPRRPREAAPYREVILLGLKLNSSGAADAVGLLEHWAGTPGASPAGDAPSKIADLTQWQQWYAEQYPDALPAELPQDNDQDKWSYEELLTFLKSGAGQAGDPARGEELFRTAQCASCHRCKSFHQGEGLGPDLTDVGKRFQQKEILESIVYPSHIISDQYASKIVVVHGRPYVGLVIPRGKAGIRLLLSDGQQLELSHEQIDDIEPSQQSTMPSSLLNPLKLEQVADLFAYLKASNKVEIARQSQTSKR